MFVAVKCLEFNHFFRVVKVLASRWLKIKPLYKHLLSISGFSFEHRDSRFFSFLFLVDKY